MTLHKGLYYRVIATSGRADYDLLMSSGLYAALTDQQKLVEHTEVAVPIDLEVADPKSQVILPQQIDFISYPYEWSFTQLQDAALLTLTVQKLALEHGMSLKDASAYNVQFEAGRPILIDTLSFEKYDDGRTWQAYRQFCQHFLAPLALMSKVDPALGLMLRDHIDGIPLPLAAKLLPVRSRLRGGLLMHLVMHGSAQQKHANDAKTIDRSVAPGGVGDKRAVLGVVESLERTIKSLKLPKRLETQWGKYYEITNYSEDSFQHKAKLVETYIKQYKSSVVWDLGGNDGTFSRAALAAGAESAVCFDVDPVAVDKNYRQTRADKAANLLPLLADLTNPSPAIGWANAERTTLAERAPQHVTLLALALVHHLAIGNNLPFDMIARYFAELGEQLIIEFVPKTDSKVQLLLATREDIFTEYDQKHFEAAFGRYFDIVAQDKVKKSERTMYLMRRRTAR